MILILNDIKYIVFIYHRSKNEKAQAKSRKIVIQVLQTLARHFITYGNHVVQAQKEGLNLYRRCPYEITMKHIGWITRERQIKLDSLNQAN